MFVCNKLSRVHLNKIHLNSIHKCCTLAECQPDSSLRFGEFTFPARKFITADQLGNKMEVLISESLKNSKLIPILQIHCFKNPSPKYILSQAEILCRRLGVVSDVSLLTWADPEKVDESCNLSKETPDNIMDSLDWISQQYVNNLDINNLFERKLKDKLRSNISRHTYSDAELYSIMDGQSLDILFDIQLSNTSILLSPKEIGTCDILSSPSDNTTNNSDLVHSIVDNEHHVNSSSTNEMTEGVVYCVSSNTNSPSENKERSPEGEQQQKPNIDQLNKLKDHMIESIPGILKKRQDYRVYTADVILENNFGEKPYMKKGIGPYVMEVAKLRFWAYFKFANVRVQVIRAAVQEEVGTVKVQWRILGIPQFRAFMFWKFIPGLYGKNMNKESESREAVSTFHLNGSGAVFKHTIDRVITDEEREVVKKPSLAARFQEAIAPKPHIGGTTCNYRRDEKPFKRK